MTRLLTLSSLLVCEWGWIHHMTAIIRLARRLLMVNSLEKSRSVSPPQPSRQPLDKKHPLAFPQSHVQPPKRNKKRKYTPPEPGSPEDVISREVIALLGEQLVARAEADATDWVSPFGFREQVELTVSSVSSSGMSLSLRPVSCRIPPIPGLFTRSASLSALHHLVQYGC
jgi:hypothetical protein